MCGELLLFQSENELLIRKTGGPTCQNRFIYLHQRCGLVRVARFTFYDDKRIGIFPMGLCYPGSGSGSGGDKPPMKTCAATWRLPVLQALGKVELTLVLGRYAIAWHLPYLRDRPVTEAVRRSSESRKGIFVLPHPSPRNNRWLKKNAWFEAQVVPRIRSNMAQVLDNTAVQ